jgi:predicted HAD superfamily phosphohydrolase
MDSSVRAAVEASYRKYFNGAVRVQREEVVKFMRFFGSEGESEPMPNSI